MIEYKNFSYGRLSSLYRVLVSARHCCSTTKKLLKLNPYNPSIPFLRPGQTVQTWRLIRVYTVQEILLKYNQNRKNASDTPKIGNGLVQLIRMDASTRQMWVKPSFHHRHGAASVYSYLYCQFNIKNMAGCSSLIRSLSAWHASGPEFAPHVRHILSWRFGREKFLRHSPSFADSRRAVVIYWRKNVH